MRRLACTVFSGRVAPQLHRCSSTSSHSGDTQMLPATEVGADTQQTPLSSRTAPRQHLHIADRVAAGRTQHLNPAYQAKWQRTTTASSISAHTNSYQRQRQRQRPSSQRHPTTTTTTGFADDVEEAQGAGGHDTRGSHARRDIPVVHPGAELPPLSQRELTEKRVGKFSFVSDPSERVGRDFYGHEVPNNTPKPKLPMWASSLTSPALGKVRLLAETWISQDARGTIDAATTSTFVRWLTDTALPPDALLQEQLWHNVELNLRRATARGVYARRAFSKGEVILTIPVRTATAETATVPEERHLTLNSEMLAAYSHSARKRPGLPDYEEVKKVLSTRRSSFDPIPHPVFIDQVHAALLLACEKAEGPSSPLFPYIQLLPSAELFDDERIKELHRGVLDPQSHMEYTEHCNRFRHYLRELHKAWWNAYEKATAAPSPQCGHEKDHAPRSLEVAAAEAATEGEGTLSNTALVDAKDPVNNTRRAAMDGTLAKDSVSVVSSNHSPPPSIEDIEWAFRVVLSRQKMLPHLRRVRDAFEHIQKENAEGDELDHFSRAVMGAKYGFYQHVLRAVDEDRARVNEVDSSTIPTVVPLLDMLNHPPGGVGNVVYVVEEVASKTTSSGPDPSCETAAEGHNKASPCPTNKQRGPVAYQVVVRAAADIEEDEELTVAYTKCYSVAYTLYRYGFLALGRREDDMAALLSANHMGGQLQPRQGVAVIAESTRTTAGWWSSLFGR